MDKDFYRKISIPFFNESLIDETVELLSHRIENRLFNIYKKDHFDIMPNVFSQLWRFGKHSALYLEPICVRCLAPRSCTPKMIGKLHWTDKRNCCTLLLPISPSLDGYMGNLSFYPSANDDWSIKIEVNHAMPLLVNSYEKLHNITNDTDSWQTHAIIILSAKYDLVVDLIDRKSFLKGLDVSFVDDDSM